MDIQHQVSIRELRQQRQEAITARVSNKKRELEGTLVRYAEEAARTATELRDLLINDDSNIERIDELIYDLRAQAQVTYASYSRLSLLRELG